MNYAKMDDITEEELLILTAEYSSPYKQQQTLKKLESQKGHFNPPDGFEWKNGELVRIPAPRGMTFKDGKLRNQNSLELEELENQLSQIVSKRQSSSKHVVSKK